MQAWIQYKDGLPATPTNFTALAGFREMGWEIRGFTLLEEMEEIRPDNLVVGYVDTVCIAWKRLGLPVPVLNTYPDELHPWLGRKVWRDQMNRIAGSPEAWPVFVKPVQDSKKFTGRLVKSTADLIGCGEQGGDTEIWCSEPVQFRAEWRCFLRYGRIEDVRPYRGDWRVAYQPAVIEAAAEAWGQKPAGCAMDFGVTADGRTLLVEVNEGYALGHYGMMPVPYARLLSARWAEVTGITDAGMW